MKVKGVNKMSVKCKYSDIKDIYFSENSIDAAFAVPGYESEFTREDFEQIVVKGCYGD